MTVDPVERLPVVGVLGYLPSPEESGQGGLERSEHAVFALNYFEMVVRNGMVPVAIPAVGPAWAEAYVDVVDGLLFTGGSDIDPELYGDKPCPQLGLTVRKRDDFELAMARVAVARRTPMLGVCRGMQLLDVALGGTLTQHVGTEDGYLRHSTGSHEPEYHDVEVVDEELRSLLGAHVLVNSLHHQAVRLLAAELRVAAISPDGLVEAAVGVDLPILAVQWHPERMEPGAPGADVPFAWLRSRLTADLPA